MPRFRCPYFKSGFMNDIVQTSMDNSKYYISDDSEFHSTGINRYCNAKDSHEVMIEIVHFQTYRVESAFWLSGDFYSLKTAHLFDVSSTDTMRIAILFTFRESNDLRIQSYHHLRSNNIVHLMHEI